MIKAVFFDINETILRLDSIKGAFEKYGKDTTFLKYWFTKLLKTSMVMGSQDNYLNFDKMAEFVLEDVFKEAGEDLKKEDKKILLDSFKSMDPFDDVAESLRILKDSNLKVLAVSNSSESMIKQQLTHAGIFNYFDNYYSVEAVKKNKPFKDIYLYASEEEGLDPSEVMMVASHDWDLYGAKSVGMKTAYIDRKQSVFYPCYPKPDLEDDSLVLLVKKIVIFQ
ncbi:haloacid dehalogenase type II [Facklamia miroungae]|uniref:2-haloacid dehalogenase n=1 Tax=Facklamia miroungae TaxID=120956 RepID=A0A1G7QAU3_9LACT|nr:haloacid dehalogenase type II [Facklamia miroungae]NKZ28883.1 haloacid dehalogenase type II [Facklamia miroungae]SDF95646.1 2-haloacid dehalogenase [Facklamia miroungae]